MDLQTFINQHRIARNIKRFSMETVLSPQDLTGHGYGVGSLFYLLCEAKGISVSSSTLFRVMNHDFVETYTGDFNKRLKDKNDDTKGAWSLIERHTVPAHAYDYSDEGIQATLTKEEYELFLLADALDAYLYCKEEVGKGNTYLERAKVHYKNSLRTFVSSEKSRLAEFLRPMSWTEVLLILEEI